MINKICTFLLAALLFTSCSSDDAPTTEDPTVTPEIPVTPTEPVVITDPVTPVITPNPSLTLPKSYSYDVLANGVKFTSAGAGYEINGDKLVSCGDGSGYTQKYTYTGDLITKIEVFAALNLAYTYDFVYENGKPASCTVDVVLFAEFARKYKYTYTHNSNGTVSYEVKLLSGKYDGVSLDGKGTLTITNGNILRDDFFPTIENADFYKKETLVYEYDAKNNWCKNIKGLNSLYILHGYPHRGNQCAVNNIISKSELEEVFNTNGTVRTASRVVYKKNYGYEYNADNYPLKITDLSDTNPIHGPTTFTY